VIFLLGSFGTADTSYPPWGWLEVSTPQWVRLEHAIDDHIKSFFVVSTPQGVRLGLFLRQ